MQSIFEDTCIGFALAKLINGDAEITNIPFYACHRVVVHFNAVCFSQQSCWFNWFNLRKINCLMPHLHNLPWQAFETWLFWLHNVQCKQPAFFSLHTLVVQLQYRNVLLTLTVLYKYLHINPLYVKETLFRTVYSRKVVTLSELSTPSKWQFC